MTYADYTEEQQNRVRHVYSEVATLTRELITLGLTAEEAYYEVSTAAGSVAAIHRLEYGLRKKDEAGEILHG